ncbi:hydantoinase/oxoprolinase N-terminal domain-containing protein [Puniceibacterium sediminis]|uniref:N-methylhydantoinase A/oxoprolinase/acetone carboxylase, beta subunit n=1 Tax=Puniceibacterium sediminis TaxID=1608407 RepID=A0A238WS43_9RHOB|nr:hydantoinase/oxoprolinase family protein [Puniceibacterium sediminis]SNR49332.1 N-methylhydantoinase A/oxoprolinase/acetone carboxylase, beta subunit [Puniceibacterium sediminis]
MSVVLGVDTGGTFTDAVLIRDETVVIAKAKALTTRADLAVGIGAAVTAVLAEAGVAAADIAMASLSTTLATNALVEGQGGRVGLVYVGFSERDLETQGLSEALGGDPVVVLAGGHSHAGGALAALDVAALESWARDQEVSAFAVAAQFATRNPEHELAARDLLRRVTGRPVTCSHELSARLGGPKRAVTAVLNARLIGLTHRLIARAEETLRALGIRAPMMVVRGDGALISAAQAQQRPIETILSGPAASLVGARWLTGARDALVSDIGGTTTDIALLRDGVPMIDPAGAQVGRFRTMVEAVAMRTYGLGGDSEVHVGEGLTGGVSLGPRRVLPVSLVGFEHGASVCQELERQLRNPVPGDHDGRFVRLVEGQDTGGLSAREAGVLARIEGLMPLGALLKTRLEGQALQRLVGRGLVQVAGVTPTDAVHVLGRLSDWDTDAARLALELMARRRIGSGERLAGSAAALAERIVDEMTQATGRALLETAFTEEGWDLPAAELARHPLLDAGLRRQSGILAFDARVALPVVGLGASARCYYPAVGKMLNGVVELPEHGDVANAIGAVVGQVAMRRTGVVTAPAEGRYRVHLTDGPQDFSAAEDAMLRLESVLGSEARAAAEAAGAVDISVTLRRDVKVVEAEAREVFIEAVVTAEASGRPRIAG